MTVSVFPEDHIRRCIICQFNLGDAVQINSCPLVAFRIFPAGCYHMSDKP